MGDPAWSPNPKFATFVSRKADEAELNKLMGAWTVQFSPGELMDLLQKNGVPGRAVLTGEEIYNDPQSNQQRPTPPKSYPMLRPVPSYVPLPLSHCPSSAKHLLRKPEADDRERYHDDQPDEIGDHKRHSPPPQVFGIDIFLNQ